MVSYNASDIYKMARDFQRDRFGSNVRAMRIKSGVVGILFEGTPSQSLDFDTAEQLRKIS